MSGAATAVTGPALSPSSIPPTAEGEGPAPAVYNYPAADVVSANLLVEGIRLSAGKGIVERCEQLWFSDLKSGINPTFATTRESSSSSSSNSKSLGSNEASLKINWTGEESGKIYPNDYTFELMSKIWVENRCKDIATRSQNLFDRCGRCGCGALGEEHSSCVRL